MSAHLDADEIDDAVRFRLAEDRIEHLIACKGCQASVDWQRMANLGSLWDEERDWACKAFEALARNAAMRGKGMVYAIPSSSVVSRLAFMGFEFERSVHIPLVSLTVTPSGQRLIGHPMTTQIEMILERVWSGKCAEGDAMQQLVTLGYEPHEAWELVSSRK